MKKNKTGFIKRHVVVLTTFLTILIASCAGYLDRDQDTDNKAALMVTTEGKTLSEAGYNEISPFLYRDSTAQNPVLFYASDRNGDFDIYYARMNADGIFEPPVSMDTQINTSADEMFPLVLNDSGAVVINFVRRTNGVYRFVYFQLSNNISFDFKEENQNTVISNGFTGMTLRRDNTAGAGTLLIYYAGNRHHEAFWAGYQIGWNVAAPSVVSNRDNKNSLSGSEMSFAIQSYTGDMALYTVQSGNHTQMYAYGIVEDVILLPITLEEISSYPDPYQSDYNDRDPHVDWFDPNGQDKVYFSSDRRNGDDFDLYRYNINTFDTVVPFVDFAEYLTNNGLINAQIPE